MPSVGVLPFHNLSRDADDEYFADGLSDELINVLAKIRGLRVAARTSCFRFKDRNEDIAVIGEKLNVATLLEGSVRRAGNRLRVAVQLVNISDGFHIWSETYDRTLEDIFAVQDDVARSVVKELRRTLLGEEPDSQASDRVRDEVAEAAKGRGENVEAHRLLLQGRYLVTRHSRELLAPAVDYLKQAIEIDPGNAMAWAWLSRAQAQQAGWAEAPVKEGNEQAEASARRALALEPSLTEGHVALGFVQALYHFDLRAADSSLQRAVELAPSNPEALSLTAVVRYQLGSPEEAITLARRAVEVDPLSSFAHGNLGRLYRWDGRLLEAEEALRKALELSPDASVWHGMLSATLMEFERPDEALAEANAERTPWGRLLSLAIIHYQTGRVDEADHALRELIKANATDGAFQIAMAYAARGDNEAAFQWLDRALAQRDSGLSIAKPEPIFRGLHGDPRWKPFSREDRVRELTGSR
jgi:TolB-like protein/Flp pilus assembly protein TadD